jgi:hypothetical protein
MQLRNWLGGLALTAALVGAGGCTVSGEARVRPVAVYEVEVAPPAPVYEVEVTQVRPGYLWIGGHYDHIGGRYVWQRGYWERPRVGSYWVPARWEYRGGRHVFVRGEWRAGVRR